MNLEHKECGCKQSLGQISANPIELTLMQRAAIWGFVAFGSYLVFELLSKKINNNA